jgi:hypothetical protein
MWVAIGDPPRRRWEHRGIVDHFAFGQWRTPPEILERDLARAIRNLYTNRLTANYRAVTLTAVVSTASLATARRVVRLVADTAGLPQEGML